MMGGILVATVLTILVLPAGYALFFGREKKKKDDVGDDRTPANQGDLFESREDLPMAAE